MNQQEKAKALLALHHTNEVLILPNIWDPFGAKLLEYKGFPAVATASAAMSFAQGKDDGQQLSFEWLCQQLETICQATSLPVTADIERGFSETMDKLANNIDRLLATGVVGINLEDSTYEGGSLVDLNLQCERISCIREVAKQQNIHLVINARCDAYLSNKLPDKLDAAIKRGLAYKEAGADCFYPILCDQDDMSRVIAEVELPVNVLATPGTPRTAELRRLGVKRLSLGPGLFKSAATTMAQVLDELAGDGTYDSFTHGNMLTSQNVSQIINPNKT
ncbi:MAG: isocitrate lyase/phosphoenolpyruvate mutase family protein [Cyclobacteriaceae bacterium]